MTSNTTFEALTAEYGNYSKSGADYALTQNPYMDTVAGSSNGYLVQGESYYFANGFDRAGNPVRLVWDITNPDSDDESNACNWEEFEVMAAQNDPAPWHPDMQDAAA